MQYRTEAELQREDIETLTSVIHGIADTLRLDLIYGLAGNPASSHLDADIVLPVKHLRVTAGTAYENGAQRIYAGLQL